jgi:hypothetical protein
MSQLAPNPKFTVYTTDSDGYTVPLVGGKVWTYAAGTSTPKATYTSYTLSATNTNPVILDTDGQADIWLDGSYKIVVTDAADVQLYSVDNIHDLTKDQTFTGVTLAGTLTVTSTAVTWSGNPTHSGNHTFTNNVTVNGNTTLGDSNTDTLTVKPNAVTWTNNPTHSGNHTFSGTVGITGVATFTSDPAGKMIGDSYTPTLTNGTNVAASTAYLCTYARVGKTVMVAGLIAIDPTAAAASLTEVYISLPIASAMTLPEHLAGTASNQAVSNSGSMFADYTNDRAVLRFYSTATSNDPWSFHFSYLVI